MRLDFEPQVLEYLSRDYLMSVLEMDTGRDTIENDGGISPYTVIVKHVVPAKYVRHIG